MTDLYADLDVAPDADAAEIKSAHRLAVKRTHPDRPGGDAEAFGRVQRAWLVLSDPARRARYDRDGDASHEPDNRAAAAIGLATQAFDAALGAASASPGGIGGHDLIAAARRWLDEHRDRLDSNAVSLRRARERCADLCARLERRGGPGGDFLRAHVTDQMAGLDGSLAAIAADLACCAAARELLDPYRYRTDPVDDHAPPAQRAGFPHMDGVQYGVFSDNSGPARWRRW